MKEHREKLEKYKADPEAYDNDGRLARNKDNPEICANIIKGRIKGLEDEIKNFKKDMKEVKDKAKGKTI
ncbi:hypothetical protein NF27_CY00080 [Candidatus Jidaibacter acanthamoeba]|uniref:Uncharacterized protein n=1 Tax=Candidatus Jidaibacter acanthamoebae TaxID=86105 RepID=A0A0C1MUJ6_9RICK|nr:hypothetical protein [Candidatus Jidaibacter acanthamoeba]KIE05772.1 hypothetical protein NF27_CY00080 [Candidatus Jidaibacter acanthamoeba]